MSNQPHPDAPRPWPLVLLLGLLLGLLLALAGGPRPALAAGQANLGLSVAPEVILADGKSDTMLTATVRDSSGNLAPDGTTVQFSTDGGTLAQDTATTLAGTARVRLISASTASVADVTATAFVGSAGGATGAAKVEFTDDRDLLFTRPDARWIQVECPQYLIYSADARVIEAQGHQGSVRLRYKALTIVADALQLDLRTQTLLAKNAVVTHGHDTLRASHLRYDLTSGDGTAVAAVGGQAARTVTVSGPALEAAPLPAGAADYYTANNIYQFADLSASRLVVSARAISVDPGRTLQFRRAAIYADGKKVLSMAYQVMPMDSNQLLGRQILGFNSTGGLAVDVPWYYHVDTHSIGTLHLRNSVIGTDGGSAGPLDATGTRPGLALDLEHTYALGAGGSGEFLLSGLTRSDWGAHWDHTQSLDPSTRAFLFVDYPAHRTLFASSNLSRQFSGFSLNMTGSGSRDPGLNGYSSSSTSLNTYLEANPRPLGRTGLSIVPSVGVQTGQYVQNAPGIPRQVIPVSTRTLDVRLFTAPLHPDAKTNLTDAFTVGQSWGNSGASSPTMLLNLGLNRVMPANGNLGLSYTWRYDPLFSQLGTDPTGGGLLGTVYHSPYQQRLSLNYSASPGRRLNFYVNGGYGLPLGDTNLYTSMSYRLNNTWGLGLGTFYDRYLGNSYSENDITLYRRILGRDLAVTYSTLTKKVRFNIGGLAF